jgi:predicted PurR-regulated permease PerM
MDRPTGSRASSIQPSHLYKTVGLTFLLAFLLFQFEAIARVLLLAFVAAILAVGLNALVQRVPLKRGLATALAALVVMGSLGVALYFIGAAVVRELRAFVGQVPEIWETLLEWQDRLQAETGLDVSLLGPRALEAAQRLPGLLLQAVGLLEVVALLVLVLFGAFFITARPNEGLLTPFLRAVPPARRDAWRRMFRVLGTRLAGWLLGTAASMAIIGALSTIVLMLLGAPYPILLGVLIGVLEIVPLVGPWIGGAVAVLVTLIHDPGLALWVALAVILIQEAEGNLIHPFVMRGTVSVHPFVTLLAVILFGSMFGLLGAVLALPIVLALQTAVQVLWVEETLDAGDDEIEPVVNDRT